MKTKHTPGQWTLHRDKIQDYQHYIITGNRLYDGTKDDLLCIIEGEHTAEPTEEDTANAQLIAAAPDLLGALKYVLSRLVDIERPTAQMMLYSDSLHPTNDDETIVDYLRDAIRKATE